MHKFLVFSFVFCGCLIMSLGIYTLFSDTMNRTIVNNTNTNNSNQNISHNVNTNISESIAYSSSKQIVNKKEIKEKKYEKSKVVNSNKNVAFESKRVTDTIKTAEIKKKSVRSKKNNVTKKFIADDPSKIKLSTNISNYTQSEINDKHILFIKHNGVHLRETPLRISNSIIRLNSGEQCIILSKEKSPVFKSLEEKENINVKDYWYKVKCKNTTGWVFGYYTSRRLNNE